MSFSIARARQRLLLIVVVFGMGIGELPAQQLTLKTDKGPLVVYDSSRALLIGQPKYDNAAVWPPLASVNDELTLVADALRRQGFSVTRMTNVKGNQLFGVISEFLSQPNGKQGRAIVYFSGHGWSYKDNAYIVGTEAQQPQQGGFSAHALSMESIRSLARDSSAKHTLFVLDSCYSGAVFTSRADIEPTPLYLEELAKRTVQFLSSGTATQRVQGQSRFASAFIDGIEGAADLDHDTIVQVAELGIYLQKIISHQTNQTPQVGSIIAEGGQMIFTPLRTPLRLAAAAGTPAPAATAAGHAPPPAVNGGLAGNAGAASAVALAPIRGAKPLAKTDVYYYRKNSDGLAILNALNAMAVPFVARPPELADSHSTDAVACGPETPIALVRTVTLGLIDAGVPIRVIYRYDNAERRGGRLQLNANTYFEQKPPLTRAMVEQLKACPAANAPLYIHDTRKTT